MFVVIDRPTESVSVNLPQSRLSIAASPIESGFNVPSLSDRLNKALDICTQHEKKIIITGRNNGATSQQFGDYIMETMENPNMESQWSDYVRS